VTSADSSLVLDRLSTSAGAFMLRPIDLHVAPGSVLVLLGPSGAGKTMLLDTIAGFRAPSGGRVLLAGREITHWAPEQRRIGVVFQHGALFPHLTVRENIHFGPRARGEPDTDRAQQLLDKFGLGPLAERSPGSLSGGERQRVALARALAAAPDLLLLDEPLSALDQPTREELQGVLANLTAGLDIPAVHVTHDREEALTLGDQIAVIVDGQLRQVDSADRITSHPADADVARLLGWTHLADGRVDRDTVILGELRLPAPARTPTGTTVSVFYRPEGLLVSPAGTSAAATTTLVRTINDILPTAPLARIHTDGDPHLTVLLLHRELARLGLRAGHPVTIQLPPDSVRTFPPTTARPTSGSDPVADPMGGAPH
jgi:ABC-type Fe3+/spermidine/putrescine transport system ATPase subunit